MEAFANTAIATFFLSLRFVPVFAFSPPFTLLRVPQTVRVLLGVSLAFWLVQSFPALT
jgi:flagellar biosynthetic protein FliR